ncbi:MAG: hypothetical protein WCC06_04815 [Candidatus Aminicenantales bacterium]
MNRKSVILLFISFIFLSCSLEKKDWEKARSANTKEAYEDFLERHPRSNFAPTASLKIEELYFRKAES